MIRWLYLCNDLGIALDGSKGASEHVRAVTRAVCATGREVCVLAARGKLPAAHPARQIETTAGHQARDTAERLRGWIERADGAPGLAGEMAQMRYDVWLAESLERADFVPPIDVVVERLSLFSTTGRLLAQRRGVPYLVEMNAPLAVEAARNREAKLNALARRAEEQMLSAADVVMTVSDALRQHVIREIGLEPERVVTVSNGVDLDLFGAEYDRDAARAEAGVPPGAVVIGFVGSLKAWHGVEALLEAFAVVQNAAPDAHLLIVGEGRLLSHYQRRAAELGVAERTTFFGGADHPTVARLMAGIDIGVAPYLPQDSFYFSPLKLYEYMAAGLCVVASRAGPIAEVIEPGVNGLLVTPGQPRELADALAEAASDGALRARLGRAARRASACCMATCMPIRSIRKARACVLSTGSTHNCATPHRTS